MSREGTWNPGKGISEPSYGVHRPSEAGPSTPSPRIEDGDDSDRPNTPPPYSGPTTPSMTAPTNGQLQTTFPGLPRLDYQLYSPQSFTLSSDQTTITSYQPRYSTYPISLVSIIQRLATVPPKPQIRIVGKSHDVRIDFDVRLNLMNMIIPEEDMKERMNYLRVIGPGEIGFRGEIKETLLPTVSGGLEGWARKFCEDPNSIKQ